MYMFRCHVVDKPFNIVGDDEADLLDLVGRLVGSPNFNYAKVHDMSSFTYLCGC